MATIRKEIAAASLLAGATIWGLIWYPYRILEAAGMSGVRAGFASYLIALVCALLLFRGRLRGIRLTWPMVAIALAAGGCNLGYVLAVLHGEVMRVLLLFYLAPVWTVLASRLLLGERLDAAGAAIILVAMCGATLILWQARLGLPWPASAAEWIGLGAGACFALTNVLLRKYSDISIEIKSIAVFSGVIMVALASMPFESALSAVRFEMVDWLILIAIGLILVAANVVVQYGLMRLPANQAAVIFLFELVVAAISSWLLAGEMLGAREWLGAALIIMASGFSGKLGGTSAPA